MIAERAEITLVAAVSENHIIGVQGGLPWSLPDDLRHFKATTKGRPVIMGRRTFEELGRNPLPGRDNIVVSRSIEPGPGYAAARSLDEALAMGRAAIRARRAERPETPNEICVIGGGEIYRQAMAHATRIVLTRVHACVSGDTSFPLFPEEGWELERREHHGTDDRHALAFTFEWWVRRDPTARGG